MNTEIQSPLPDRPKSRPIKQILAALITLAILAAASMVLKKYWPATQQPATAQKTQNLDFVPQLTDQPAPLKNIANFSAVKNKFGLNLTAAEEKYLDQNRFLLVDASATNLRPNWNFDDMLNSFDVLGGSGSIYDRRPEDTKLITPDVMLHTYHKFFEMTLEQLEQKELAQSLGDFLTELHGNLLAATQTNSGVIQQRYQNLLAQMTVARILFENKNAGKPDSFVSPDQETAYNDNDKTADSYANAKTLLAKYSASLTPELISSIQSELQNIYTASAVGVSPLFGQYSDTLKTDYTQFTPRSHYTKNSPLRAYFRTMMYLGRSSYFLQKDVGIIDANLLTGQFNVKNSDGRTPLQQWQKIMAVTGFYAGQSDDLTYDEWNSYKTKILGPDTPNTALAAAKNVKKLADNLNQIRMPKILSDVVVDDNISALTKSDLLRQSLAYRIFGQRFTFDAWILNDLTAGGEKTEVKLPSMPSAVFIPAALGDMRALDIAKTFLQTSAGFNAAELAGFFTKMESKKTSISIITHDDWFTSMGSGWLYVLGSLTYGYGSGYPLYMQAPAFLDKQIQTFLGSYTELKHVTLLYAKQSYAEKGGGGDDQPVPPVVKGFVEPNLDFWNRFNELLNQTQKVFAEHQLFIGSTVSARLAEFKNISEFYASLAKQELQNRPISDADYEKLRTTSLSFMVQPLDNTGDPDEDSGKVALIADVHTDALTDQILYEADGKPYLMLAIVSNENSPRVVAGLAYNHYEFTHPLGGQRLTDEDWRNWVYNQTEKLPTKNFWYDSLRAK